MLTLIERIQQQAKNNPDRIIYRWEYFNESHALTYQKLDQQCRQIASHLTTHHTDKKFAILTLEPSLDYIVALFSCFYANIVAVPHYPPKNKRQQQFLDQAIQSLPDALIISSLTDFTQNHQAEFQPVSSHKTATAYLQYTSGSIANPKAVMISQQNILANCEAIRQHYDRDGRIICSWLPPFHDMGLVGAIFCAIYGDRQCILMRPLDFIRRPLFLLETINKYRASATLAANFSLALLTRKIKHSRTQLNYDLSCLDTIITGSEPLQKKTINEFITALKPYNIKNNIISPAYGLAEATLIVSATTQHTAFKVHQNIISVGKPVSDHKIKIIDPNTQTELPQYQTGEIYISGPSVATGYWQQPELTQETFTQLDGTYLKTGDLGFFDDAGNLYITGRSKALIILNGQNYFAYDLEHSVESSHPEIYSQGTIIFDDFAGHLICVTEVNRHSKTYSDIFSSIADALQQDWQITPSEILLIARGLLPRTTSNKKRRNYCHSLWKQNNLKHLAKNTVEKYKK